MPRKQIQFDARRRAVTLDGRSTVLQEKAWQVLCLLRERAPAVVTRREIIGIVWSGNHLTGEKGVNQAVWSLRTALRDEARSPRFIRTVPRVGYQWLCERPSGPRPTSAPSVPTVVRWGAAAAVLLAAVAAYQFFASPEAVRDHPPQNRTATDAYLVGHDIHVRLASGCLGIVKNTDQKMIGEPVVSADGAQVAFTLREDAICRLVVLDLPSGQKREFGECPLDLI